MKDVCEIRERELEGTAARNEALFGPSSALDDRTAEAESGHEVMAVAKMCAGDKVR